MDSSVEKGARWLEAGHTSEAADSRLDVSIEAAGGLQVCREGLVWVSHLGRNQTVLKLQNITYYPDDLPCLRQSYT